MPPTAHIPHSERVRFRVRSTKACAPCRKRKVKCDGNEPCAACTGYGYDCIFTKMAAHQSASSTIAAASPSRSTVSNGEPFPPKLAPPAASIVTVTEPFMSQESIIAVENRNPNLFQTIKTRFTSSYSAVAWPKRLGISLGIPNPPRLQAFGWNPGTRTEQIYAPPNTICDIITLVELMKFADVYFKEVHPFFGMIDPETFTARANEFWAAPKRGEVIEACMCGIFALGSYFSGLMPAPFESQVVEQGRLLLDMSFAHPPAMVSVQHVVALTLRALYLRHTTRPHLSWIASCTAVHLAESIGLHREISDIRMLRSASPLEVELRRRAFWVTMSVHQYFSSEYGRSRITLEPISRQYITSQVGDSTLDTLAILQAVPEQSLLGRIPELLESLRKAISLPATSPFLTLLRADACFCIYRMLRSSNSRLPADQVPPLLEVVRAGLDAVALLGNRNHAWWNLVSTPFHAVCILISIGLPESLAMIPSALGTLKNITTIYNSHLSKEAFQTVRSLVQGARDMKSKELESLDQSLGIEREVVSPASNPPLGMSDLEWPMGSNLGFLDFLDLTNYYDGIESPY